MQAPTDPGGANAPEEPGGRIRGRERDCAVDWLAQRAPGNDECEPQEAAENDVRMQPERDGCLPSRWLHALGHMVISEAS